MKEFQKLSDTEMEVMQAIWELNRPVSSGELLQSFAQKGREWKAQTIVTFLARLVEKGVLISEKRGRANAYRACVSQEEYESLKAKSLLDRMYQGSVKNFLTALYSGGKVSGRELEELKKWFEER